ncbi:hypothetical protein [Shimia thalassica]|uniref:hypothetical protein n=1 Tax=Shimia thalassica TaxID=1715693 RepID=UPI0026E26DC5|nr:hypothetical protein [Shimia thalassica]MDO6800277.1 hypothetical protein [Shimia thalassica]
MRKACIICTKPPHLAPAAKSGLGVVTGGSFDRAFVSSFIEGRGGTRLLSKRHHTAPQV